VQSRRGKAEIVPDSGKVSKLAESIQSRLDALDFAGGRAQKALALYAGHQLANAEDPDMQLKWFRECLNLTKLGLQSNSKERDRLAKELSFTSSSIET